MSGALWSLALALAERRRAGGLPEGPVGLWWADAKAGAAARLVDGAVDDARALLCREADGRVVAGPALAARAREALGPWLSLLSVGADQLYAVAHLGQSVDGCVATASGDSEAVTGEEDFVHMHRLRALVDAVVVGAGTAREDDPRLTTRLVEGPSPARVVVDPRGRLDTGLGLFVDGAAPTLWARRAGVGEGGHTSTLAAHVERLDIDTASDAAFLPALRDALAARGLRVLMIEGGGVTVTRWLEAGLLDRLQLAVAPVLIGRGRAGLQLDSARSMAEAPRPPCRRYRLGDDVLWDFALRDRD